MGPKEGLKEGALTANTGSNDPRNNRREKPNNSTDFKGKCFNCGKTGHKKSECTKPKYNPSTGPLAAPNGGRGLSPGLGQGENRPIWWRKPGWPEL
jgi:hypothetical protein